MSYTRVIPRDLFNESKLLKCMGQISLKIHDGVGVRWPLELTHDDSDIQGFEIEQRDSDGGLVVRNLTLSVKGNRIEVYSSYNSKSLYPLIFEDENTGDCDTVFNEAGEFSDEFKNYLDARCKGIDDDN